MATNYEKTPKLGLSLYGDNDPSDLRDGHNTNMNILDGKVSENILDIAKKADKTYVDSQDQALQTKIDEKADKTYVDSQDQALQTKIDEKADKTSVYPRTETYSRIELDAKFNAMVHKDQTVLCIGDSFGAVTNDHGSWVTEIKKIIPKYNFVSTCESGTGFWRDFGTNFKGQLTKASGDKVLPDKIIIAGGVNDTDAPLTDLATSVANTITTAQTLFPSVPIYMVPMMAGYYHLTLQRRKVAAVIDSKCSQYGIPYIDKMWYWNVGIRDNVISDNLHPTENGARKLAQIIAAFINGHAILPVTDVTEVVWNTTGSLRYWVERGRAYVSWQGGIDDPTKFDHILALPESMASTATERNVSGYTSSGTAPLMGTFFIADNVEGMKFNITSPIVAGQLQLMLSYEI